MSRPEGPAAGFTVRAALTVDGQPVTGQPGRGASKKTARQLAALSLVATLAGLPDPVSQAQDPDTGDTRSCAIGSGELLAACQGSTMNEANPSRGATLLSMSPVSRGRKSKKQKKAQKSRQRSAGAAVQREDTQFADLLAAGSQPGQPSSGLRGLAALVDQLAGPRERPAWFGPSIGRILCQQDAVIAATGPRKLEQVVTELAGAEVYWALNEAKRGLWFEWWFEELVRAATDRVRAEAAGEGGGWQAPWRLLHGLAAIGSPALRSAVMQAVKDVGRALTRQQSSAAPDWPGFARRDRSPARSGRCMTITAPGSPSSPNAVTPAVLTPTCSCWTSMPA